MKILVPNFRRKFQTKILGALPSYRTPQFADFMDSLRHCDERIPVLVGPGNRDLGNDKVKDEDFDAFEKQAMQIYFYFEFGGRYFMTIDTQVYKMTNGNAVNKREKQDAW